MNQKKTVTITTTLSIFCFSLLLLQACTSKREPDKTEQTFVSVITIDTTSMVTHKHFSAVLEGVVNVEIRPQVEGYLEKIYIDEGSYVHQGQPLFFIDDKPYREQWNNADAALLLAKANAEKAGIEVARLEKLVEGKVISKVQLDHAKTLLDAAAASVAQAEAIKKSASINKDFTLIKAPVSGYIGGIPYKVGSLIGRNEPLPLTLLSDIHDIHAYFSMSETEFLQFKQQYEGNTIEEKIRHVPPVTLVLPDDSEYPEKGKIEIVYGQFDKTTAAITFRVTFPNTNGLLRSGNTGKVVLLQQNTGIIQVPQAATFEIQNKVMAYVLGKDNTLSNAPLKIMAKNDTNYIVAYGLKPGDRIVAKGLEHLHEGMVVKPVLK